MAVEPSNRQPTTEEAARAAGHVGSVSPLEPVGGRLSWAPRQWHTEDVQHWPTAVSQFDDVPRLFREHILPGHLPPRPLLEPDDLVVTLGSCFAAELRRVLELAEFSASSFWVPSGLNNSFALLDFVSWCITGSDTARGYRYERTADGTIREWMPAAEREGYRAYFERAGCVVLTLGLAEVWSERDTGAVFWRGVPEHVFDERRHVFRVTSVDENVANILSTIDLVRTVNPDAPIVLALSPVPLRATFRDVSCVSADSVSKSILRVALDEVMRTEPNGVYYWPSFELVKWGGPVFDWRAFRKDSGHPDDYLVYCIVTAFVEAFYGGAAAAELRRRLRGAGFSPGRPHRLRYAANRSRHAAEAIAGRARRAPARLERDVRGLLARGR